MNIDDDIELELMEIISDGSDEPWSPQDDDELQHIIGIIESARRPIPRARDLYAMEIETSKRAAELLNLPGAAANSEDFMGTLKVLQDFHAARAESIKPSIGKDKQPQKRFIVWALWCAAEAGDIRIQPASNVDSRFARLFRACCRAAGLKPSTNIDHYLTAVQNQG